ncbi:MAG: undecaprenyldiphospho-muramoylpentapeptide beta-N-acetylglucosaminyltransferase [Gammaproteobacteria bacterium]|nr:MAG: undecaprenyldiphospho-muramoylpentapeptide beta-N-acetylglucosaminyltransferase [Gammaproteobacteria bacterium]
MTVAAGNRRPVLIMAGGTGGHVFPALAVANELTALGVPVSWLGTRQGLEARVVPAAGYSLATIRVSALRGKGLLRKFLAPVMLSLALWQTLMVFLRLRPAAVLGMGGFVAGPGGVTAWLLRRPLLIHEQNAIPGNTNRLLAPLARRIMEGFPGSFPAGRHALHTGNPVRADIIALPSPEKRFTRRDAALRLLIVGGSLGAQALNKTVPDAISRLPENERPLVHHQTGASGLTAVQASYRNVVSNARIEAFISDMAAAYAWADLVVCRAGALTVAELAAAGVGSVLVPFPYAVDDHQTANASYLVRAGAAILVPQTELSATALAEILARFHNRRAALLDMAREARSLARPDAARQVAGLCLEAAGYPTGVAA